jgi:hypothetical protein
MVLWLGSQPIPFNQQAPEAQRRVPRDFGSYVSSARELRTDFSASLDSWGANFAEELKKAALELVEINPSARFVETQLGTICSEVKKREAENWKAWSIPGWMIAWPEPRDGQALLDATFHGQLDARGKSVVLDGISQRVADSLDLARKSALDNVKVQAAKKRRSAHASSRLPSLNKIKMRIAVIKRRHPGASIEKICQRLDGSNAPIPSSWKKAGMSTWHEAWTSTKLRSAVKAYISKVPRAAKD